MRMLSVLSLAFGLGIWTGLAMPLPALSQSSETQCELSGGDFDKDGSIATCSYPVGSSSNTKIIDQKGSFSSSHPETKTNPGGNQPPGQQGGNTLGN